MRVVAVAVLSLGSVAIGYVVGRELSGALSDPDPAVGWLTDPISAGLFAFLVWAVVAAALIALGLLAMQQVWPASGAGGQSR